MSTSNFENVGDHCYGASKPDVVIYYEMAGGGAHWWKYEVHYEADTGEQNAVYILDQHGRHHKTQMRLYYHEENSDCLLLADIKFSHEMWHEMMHYS